MQWPSVSLLCCCCSASKSCLTLQPRKLQHSRLPCPSLSPRVCSNSCPLSWWCYPTHLILCHFLLLLPSIFPSIRVFSNESALPIRWPKYWSFSFNIKPSNEHPGLISFRMDWLDLLAVQGTLKSLLQDHSYSAIKRNAFESFLMRLMNLKPIIQSEVSQKEKDNAVLHCA